MSKLLKMMGAAPQGIEPFSRTAADLIISLLITLALAAVMMGVYRLCHDSLTYRHQFNVTLMMLALASTLLLTLIENNPMFSLGALGALSICRIRTNTRDPRDLGFVFWSLLIGISSALTAYAVGLMGTVVLSLVMLTIGTTGQKKKATTMVIRGQKDKIQQVQDVLRHTGGSTIQSKNVFADSFEMVYELNVPRAEEEQLLLIFNSMDGINGVNVLAPETEVA